MNTYTFSPLGVAQWQADLYAADILTQQAEKEMIRDAFEHWLVERFQFNKLQLAYVQQLEPRFVDEIQSSLIQYISYQLPIILDKDENTSRAEGQESVKITEIRKWWEQRDGAPAPENPPSKSVSDLHTAGALNIKIVYLSL